MGLFLCYIEAMKLDKSKTHNLSDLPSEIPSTEPPMFRPPKTWTPGELSQTMQYGKGVATPSPSLKKLAHMQAEEEFPYLTKNDPIIHKRAKEVEKKMREGASS